MNSISKSFYLDKSALRHLETFASKTGMSHSLIVRRLIAQAAKQWELTPVDNFFLRD
jgi:hypothetical protein